MSQPAQMSQQKLFVGSLPPTCTQEQLMQVMSGAGPVTHVHMMTRPTATGSICAFVEFATPEAAQAAIEMFDHKVTIPPHNIPLTCSVAQHRGSQQPSAYSPVVAPGAGGMGMLEAKLFVGNLPATVTEQEIRDVFGTYGAVNKVVLINKPSPTGNRSAFVIYEDISTCQGAIQALNNNYMFAGGTSNVVVRFADSAQGRPTPSAQAQQAYASPYGAPPMGSSGLKLFVGNLPAECTQQQLTDVMAPYGQVTHVHMMTNPTSTGAICAFVEYASHEQALAAIQALNGVQVMPPREGPMTVTFAKTRAAAAPAAMAATPGYYYPYPQQQQQQAAYGYSPYQYPPYGGYPQMPNPYSATATATTTSPAAGAPQSPGEVKLFVGNLPLDMTQDALREMFVPYGNMLEAFLFKRGTETAKGAFVRFSDSASAQQAISTLNGTEVSGQRILVQLARSSSKGDDGYASAAAAAAGGDAYSAAGAGSAAPAGYPYGGYGYGAYAGYGYDPAAYGAAAAAAPANPAEATAAAAAAAAAASPQAGGGDASQTPASTASSPDAILTVANLPPNYDQPTVASVFGAFGPTRSVQLYNDDASSEPSGGLKAVVAFETAAAAQAAQQAMNNFQMGGGYKLRCTIKAQAYRPY